MSSVKQSADHIYADTLGVINQHNNEAPISPIIVQHNERRSISWVCIVLCLVSIGISIVALANVYPSNAALRWDYLGIIVGIITVLITALLGWQVFSLIKLEEIRKNYKQHEVKFLSLQQDINSKARLLNAESTMLHGAHYLTWFNTTNDLAALRNAYYMLAHALRNYTLELKKDLARKCIGMMKECVCEVHNNNAWDVVFDDETNNSADQDFTVVFRLIGYLEPNDANLLMQIRKSRKDKFLCPELLKDKYKPKTKGGKAKKQKHN